LFARLIGIGIETADMLVREILSRKLRDRRAVARHAVAETRDALDSIGDTFPECLSNVWRS
jgi:hypothetical protein